MDSRERERDRLITEVYNTNIIQRCIKQQARRYTKPQTGIEDDLIQRAFLELCQLDLDKFFVVYNLKKHENNKIKNLIGFVLKAATFNCFTRDTNPDNVRNRWFWSIVQYSNLLDKEIEEEN